MNRPQVKSNSEIQFIRPETSFRDIVSILGPSRGLEIGSWKGRSVVTFLHHDAVNAGSLRMTCVDTWLGSPEHWSNRFPGTEWSFDSLGVRKGEPTILDEFRENIRLAGFHDRVEIIRCTSAAAFVYLGRLKDFSPFDFVYIDGDHSFAAVSEDLRGAELLVAKEGVIAGDDFDWNSVRKAVHRFRRRGSRSLLISPDRKTYVFVPRHRSEIRLGFENAGWVLFSLALRAEFVRNTIRKRRRRFKKKNPYYLFLKKIFSGASNGKKS